jgi:hypothetical protein
MTPEQRATKETEIGAIRREIKILAVIECSDCDEARTENIQTVDIATARLDLATTAWKHGWIVESDVVFCPDCQEND